MDLIMAHIYNGTAGGHGVIHPTCRSCFDTIANRWAKNPALGLRFDEVMESDSEPDSQYEPNECFYCQKGES